MGAGLERAASKMSVTASPVHQMLETISSPTAVKSPSKSPIAASPTAVKSPSKSPIASSPTTTEPLKSPAKSPAKSPGSQNRPKVDTLVSSPVNRPPAQVVNDGSVTLRGRPSNKLKTGGWKSAFFFYGVTLSDAVAVIGLAANLATYLVYDLHIVNPDEVATTLTNFMGVTFLLPLFWGFLADAYLGKYLTICLSSVIFIAGSIVLMVQSATPKWLPPFCPPQDLPLPKCAPPGDVKRLFLTGLYLLSVGSAGVKPCVASMGQEQFEEGDEVESKQRAHFFTGFYVSINLGAVIAVTLLTWAVTDHPWKWGFVVITAFIVVGVVGFFIGTPFYRNQKPAGSALTRLAQPLVAAIRKFGKDLPQNSSELYELGPKDLALRGIRKVAHTDRLRVLDRAAIKDDSAEDGLWETSPWRLCTVTQVEDLKAVLNIVPIWTANFLVYTIFAQITGFTIQQSLTLDRKVGRFIIPAPSFGLGLLMGALASVVVWEFALVPVVRRFTGRPAGFSDLQRLGVGLVASIFSMVAAALAEQRRVELIKSHNIQYSDLLKGALVPMSVFYLMPQYLILGFVEFVVGVAQLNFFAREIPDGMRGLGTSLYFSAIAMGYLLSSLLVKVVNKVTEHGPGSAGWLQAQGIMEGGLAKFYWLLAAMIALNSLIYVLFAWLFVPKKLSLEPGVGEDDAPS